MPSEGRTACQETFVQRNQHRIYVREYPGAEPTIVLMHGFPDNLHLYDRLVPHLSPLRRVVVFDFLGWGASDKPPGYPYTASSQVGDLDAVSTLRPPEAIWLFSTPLVRNIARPVSQMFGHWIFRRMYQWQVGRFFRDAEVRNEFLPLLYQQFDATPGVRPAFFRLNEDLLPTIRSRTKMLPKLREFRRPVRIIFGDADPYLNKGVAQRFHELFPVSELFLVPGARHFVQMDEPGQVARLILAMPRSGIEAV